MTHIERIRAESKAGLLGDSQHVVTPDNDTVFPPSAIMNLDNGAAIEVVDRHGTSIVYSNAPAFWVVPVLCVQVKAAGTTSTKVVRYQ